MSSPTVWVIDAYREGERSQLKALVAALDWPAEIKRLSYRKFAARTNLLRGSDLGGINADDSSPLAPPWPDLIISAGMRNEPVCRWIRNQSGGRSRIVHVGRPWADPSRFDLVVTTPQYRLPQRDNVVQNTLPLNLVVPSRLAEAKAKWEARLRHLPPPYISVVIGGNSGPYTLGVNAAKRLRENAVQMARERGGSLLVTTSARTGDKVIDVLEGIDEVPCEIYRWQPGDADNPYFGFLAMADELIVTADSISMLSEACATGKPVWMFDLAVGEHSMSGNPSLNREWQNDRSLGGFCYGLLMRWGWQRLSRDITLVHRELVSSGRASWLGEPPVASVETTGGEDMARAVDAIQALLGVTASQE